MRHCYNLKKPILAPGAGGAMAPTGKFEFNNAELQRMITDAKAVKTPKNVTDGYANLEKIVKHMENSGNWGSVMN